MQTLTPRGIRLNNPGNIRHGDKWQGLDTAHDKQDSEFCTFIAPEWGIRAMCVILNNYQVKNGISTIRGAISRWAPPTENDTEAYVKAVAAAVGVRPDEEVRLAALFDKLVPAIIKHENGMQPYSAEVIHKAIALGGFQA